MLRYDYFSEIKSVYILEKQTIFQIQLETFYDANSCPCLMRQIDCVHGSTIYALYVYVWISN